MGKGKPVSPKPSGFGARPRSERPKQAQAHDDGEQNSMAQVIAGCLPMVASIAKRYRNFGLPLEDLQQEGCIGAIEAFSRWDPKRAKFSTFASWWIKKRILRALDKHSRMVRLPTHVLRRLQAEKKSLTTESVRGAQPEGKARYNVEQVRLGQMHLSLDSFVGDGRRTRLSDALPEHTAPNPIERLNYQQSCDHLREALRKLSQKEQYVLQERYAMNAQGRGRNFKSIAKDLGCSHEWVRQIELAALKKLFALLTR